MYPKETTVLKSSSGASKIASKILGPKFEGFLKSM